jgi:hypothetical protein
MEHQGANNKILAVLCILQNYFPTEKDSVLINLKAEGFFANYYG